MDPIAGGVSVPEAPIDSDDPMAIDELPLRLLNPRLEERLSDITLRLLTLDDGDDLMVWAGDPEVARFGAMDPFRSRDDALCYIKNVALPHPWHRAICLRGTAIGEITVTRNMGAHDRCRGEIGYTLASRYWGKGIGTAAVKATVVAVFRERPELERVEALVDVGNVASQRVLEKVGFTREGVLRKYFMLKGRVRDMVMFSFLSTDPFRR